MALHTSQFMDSMVKTCVASAGQFFANKTCANLVHKFVMHHVNYEFIPWYLYGTFPILTVAGFNLSKGQSHYAMMPLFLAHLVTLKSYPVGIIVPPAIAKFPALDSSSFEEKGTASCLFFLQQKRENNLCKKPARQTMGANLSRCRGGGSSARDGAVKPKP